MTELALLSKNKVFSGDVIIVETTAAVVLREDDVET